MKSIKLLLIAAIALCIAACGEKKNAETAPAESADTTNVVAADTVAADTVAVAEETEPAFEAGVYKCTGDRVRVRKAPNTESGMVYYDGGGDWEGPVYLDKGDCVTCKGEVENGFAKVYCKHLSGAWTSGWTSVQFLTKAAKCGKCGGKGYLNEPCMECEGYGCCSCAPGTDGKQYCMTCGGYGYK
jgi:hypothetical protein